MKRWILYGLISAFLAWFGGFVWFAHYINSYDIDTHTKTDAIIVLTGGRNRISEGIRLLNDNLADKLFISGVPTDISIKQIEKQANITADDESKIELGRKAKNTLENAIETEGLIGIFTGSFTACAGGVGASLIFALIAAIFSKPNSQS